jgi:GTPase
MELPQLTSIKLAIVGNVDSGKTTLVGVLSKGSPDDGRGSARIKVFNYPHEVQNGRTSSIAQEIIGFDNKGEQVLPDRYNPNKNKYWPEVVKKSSKIINMIDLCGHEKYLKTTLFGLVGLDPDYVTLIIGANMGVSKMTKEHLGITLCLKIPFFIVLTKIDLCPDNIYKENLENLMKLMRSNLVNRVPIVIKSQEELMKLSDSMLSDRICPIFPVSSVTAQGIPHLLAFLSLLKNRIDLQSNQAKPFHYDITENFLIPGIACMFPFVAY